MRPDFKQFIGSGLLALSHSAKGTTWKEHKYIQRKDGTYYYPDSYEGGRHLPDGEKDDSDKENTKEFDEFESFAKELMAKGEAYWDADEVSKMTKEELADLYEDITGVKLGDKDLDRLFNSREARISTSGKENSLSETDVENLAKEVIRGNFGNGQERKDLLGEYYQQIQDRVNELMKGSSGSTKVSEISEEEVKEAEKVVEEAVQAVTKAGLDFETIYSVYRKKT